MAKSLRSKSKMSFRAKKRTSDKSAFKQVDQARAQRLSARLAVSAQQKKLSEIGKDEEMQSTRTQVEDEAQDGMNVDGEVKAAEGEKKVSTSGPRQSGRRQWKEAKGIKINKRLSQVTTFKGRSQRKGKDGRIKP